MIARADERSGEDGRKTIRKPVPLSTGIRRAMRHSPHVTTFRRCCFFAKRKSGFCKWQRCAVMVQWYRIWLGFFLWDAV